MFAARALAFRYDMAAVEGGLRRQSPNLRAARKGGEVSGRSPVIPGKALRFSAMSVHAGPAEQAGVARFSIRTDVPFFRVGITCKRINIRFTRSPDSSVRLLQAFFKTDPAGGAECRLVENFRRMSSVSRETGNHVERRF